MSYLSISKAPKRVLIFYNNNIKLMKAYLDSIRIDFTIENGLLEKHHMLFSLLDKARLDNSHPFEQYTIGVYLTGDRDRFIIKNKATLSNKKILLLKDSFGVPVGAFLSLIAKEVDMLDLRYYKDEPLKDYIEKTKPDIVVFCYNPTTILRSDAFEFY